MLLLQPPPAPLVYLVYTSIPGTSAAVHGPHTTQPPVGTLVRWYNSNFGVRILRSQQLWISGRPRIILTTLMYYILRSIQQAIINSIKCQKEEIRGNLQEYLAS